MLVICEFYFPQNQNFNKFSKFVAQVIFCAVWYFILSLFFNYKLNITSLSLPPPLSLSPSLSPSLPLSLSLPPSLSFSLPPSLLPSLPPLPLSSSPQTRGSIPLHWSQRPTLKYKPTPKVDSTSTQQETGIQLHFDRQIVHYGRQTVVNLINQKGSEKTLGDAFQYFVQKLSSLPVV